MEKGIKRIAFFLTMCICLGSGIKYGIAGNNQEIIESLEQQYVDCADEYGKAKCENMRKRNLNEINRLYGQQQRAGKESCVSGCYNEGQRSNRRCQRDFGTDIAGLAQCLGESATENRLCLADC